MTVVLSQLRKKQVHSMPNEDFDRTQRLHIRCAHASVWASTGALSHAAAPNGTKLRQSSSARIPADPGSTWSRKNGWVHRTGCLSRPRLRQCHTYAVTLLTSLRLLRFSRLRSPAALQQELGCSTAHFVHPAVKMMHHVSTRPGAFRHNVYVTTYDRSHSLSTRSHQNVLRQLSRTLATR